MRKSLPLEGNMSIAAAGGEGPAWLWRKRRRLQGGKHMVDRACSGNEPDLGKQGITKGAETLKNGEPLRILGKHQEEPLNFKVSFQEKCLSFQACRLSQQK